MTGGRRTLGPAGRLALLLVIGVGCLSELPLPAQIGGPQPFAPLIISEFRLSGPSGNNDEFVEIYNASDFDVTVASPSSSGYALAASNGVRFIIPNGTVIPARGHFLGVNSLGYTLGAYPAGVGTTATGDATYTTDIPDNMGIALFRTSNPAEFSFATRLDAVGSESEMNPLYFEGTPYPPQTPTFSESTIYRHLASRVFPLDTNNNRGDIQWFGSTTTTNNVRTAPGPENLSSPVQTNSGLAISLLDPGVDANAAPNMVRDFTSDPANLSTFGTVSIRRVITNNTGVNVTRLRIRLTFVEQSPVDGTADTHPRSSANTVVVLPGGAVTVVGTTLEQPPLQPLGGGQNSSMAVTLAAPLPPGSSLPFQLLYGLQTRGEYSGVFNVEALPRGGVSSVWMAGETQGCAAVLTPTYAVFPSYRTGGRIDVSIPAACGQWFAYGAEGTEITSSQVGTGNGAVQFRVLANPSRLARIGTFVIGNAVATMRQHGRAHTDFNSDALADFVIYRPSTGQWWIRYALDPLSSYYMESWGLPSDKPVPADFDGDGVVDPAVFRPGAGGNSFWLIRKSSIAGASFAVHWGTAGDQPVPGYYDGDTLADPAVYRPSTGQWLIARSLTDYAGSFNIVWGIPGDVPVPADYDGDGRTDIAVYRPSTGQWFIKRSATGFTQYFVVQWGVQSQGDQPLPADYDGDGKADPAVYRPGIGYWFIRRSSTWYVDSLSLQWGVQSLGDQPMPGDYDGDGKADPAVYRPGIGYWFVRRSSTNYSTFMSVPWGSPALGDIAIRER